MEAIAFDFLKSITFEFCSRSELRSLWREIEEVIRLLEGKIIKFRVYNSLVMFW